MRTFELGKGQGGSQAIEDAGALAVSISELQSFEDVPRRLDLVQKNRRDRAGAMRIFLMQPKMKATELNKVQRHMFMDWFQVLLWKGR